MKASKDDQTLPNRVGLDPGDQRAGGLDRNNSPEFPRSCHFRGTLANDLAARRSCGIHLIASIVEDRRIRSAADGQRTGNGSGCAAPAPFAVRQKSKSKARQ
jgi:hypothetical protein